MTPAIRRIVAMAIALSVWADAARAQGAASSVASGSGTASTDAGAVLDQRRRAVDARYVEDRTACRSLFAVNDCLEQAKTRHREAIEQIRRDRQALDDVKRRERAEQRGRSIEANRAQSLARGPEAPASAAGSRSAASRPPSDAAPSTRAGRAASVPRSSGASAAEAKRSPGPETAAQAERRRQRASESEQRRIEAQAHRQDVLRRNAERDRKRPPAAGLPVPGPASAASQPVR